MVSHVVAGLAPPEVEDKGYRFRKTLLRPLKAHIQSLPNFPPAVHAPDHWLHRCSDAVLLHHRGLQLGPRPPVYPPLRLDFGRPVAHILPNLGHPAMSAFTKLIPCMIPVNLSSPEWNPEAIVIDKFD